VPLMDMITESLLEEFSKEQELTKLPKDQRFEHFAAYITVRRQYSETFDTFDIHTGKGGDTGIDAFAAIVNGALITDVSEFEDVAAAASYLDVVFIFVSAQQTASFDTAKIGNFGYGVGDFFSTDRPKLARNDKIDDAVAIMKAIYKRSAKFKRGNPACKLYYVTTGRFENDRNLLARRDAVISDLKASSQFSAVDFYLIGAEGIQKLYWQAKNAISREFEFSNRTVMPAIAGIKEAYLGLLPAGEVLNILRDDDGEMTKSIFYDNVRDWQDFNDVNSEIRATLLSDTNARFALMNNGITIIARHLQPTGNRFHIEDFQIVNGCQTSHVLFEVAREHTIDNSVMIPLRVIATQDEDVINAIIRATNRQTQVQEDQFFALTDFPKQLEAFFDTFPDAKRLYYERRSRQYDSMSIEKTRIVTQVNLTRAFAAMFMNEAHSVTRRYKSISAKIGTEIFGKNHKLHPYYVAAYALYKLEYLFRSHKVDSVYKIARYQILLALRLLMNPSPMPPMNSHAMERYCDVITKVLWDQAQSEEAFASAINVVDTVAKGNFDRDVVRSFPFTEGVIKECALRATT
jgi:hypothetical protein